MSRRPIPWLTPIPVCVLLAGLLGGPRRATPAGPPLPPPPPASGSQQAADLPAGLGQTCAVDRDCPGYLRCQKSACAVPPALHGDGPPVGPAVRFELGGGREASFRVELAKESFEQTRGLMFRPAMDPQWGMIFVYGRDEERSFWMRNTLIPLDMVFLAGDGHVACTVERAEPLTLDTRSCGRPSRHVLELVAGTVRRLGLRAGNPYQLVDFPADALPGAGGAQGGGR